MKIILTLFSLSLSLSAFAAEKDSAERNCIETIEEAIRTTAKAMGVNSEFKVILSEPVNAGKDFLGKPFRAYHSSAFMLPSGGYLSGSGATAVVRSVYNNCEIAQLTVSVGYL